MILTPIDIFKIGLSVLNIRVTKRHSRATRTLFFQKNYGSSPLVLAAQWYNLCKTTIDTETEKSVKIIDLHNLDTGEKGLKCFFMTHYWLWTKQKKLYTFAQRFQESEQVVKTYLFNWIKGISALKERKIVLPEEIDREDSEIYCCTVDGTDFL